MAEEEKKAEELLDSTTSNSSIISISSISERRKMFREKIELKKRLREEYMLRNGKSIFKKRLPEDSILRTTLLKAAYIHQNKLKDVGEDDYVPAIEVSIAGYSRFTGKDVSVTACFSFKHKRLYWEIVEGPLRRRICVVWDGIRELELKLNECGLACLTVEVNRPPSFEIYKGESDRWSHIRDITDDDIDLDLQSHYVVFKPGTVDESYEKLVNCRKEQAVVREKHRQRVQEKSLGLQKRVKLRENLHQILESKLLEKEGTGL